MGETLILPVTEERLADVRPFYRSWLQRALEYDLEEMSADFVLDNVPERFLLFDIIEDSEHYGVAVLELVQLPSRKCLHVVALTGESQSKWLADFVDVLKKVAAEQGCQSVTMKGRVGWGKLLKPLGFDQLFTVMECKM